MRTTSTLFTPALLAACTVGPNYGGPPAVTADSMAAHGFVRAEDAAFVPSSPLALWWEGLNDPMLNKLVEQALANNPTIDVAQARIREAGAQLTSRRADAAPRVGANVSDIQADIPAITNGMPWDLNIRSLGLTASWEPDLFGGKHRRVEQAKAQVGERFAALADAQVSLSALVTTTYVGLRAAQEKKALYVEAFAVESLALALARKRYDSGTGTALDVARLETQLETSRVQEAALAAELDASLDQLAVLTGQRPGALNASLATATPIPSPPKIVPIGDPGAMIANRPDIRAAERRLAAKTAGIGVAEARRLPGLRFFGLLGIGGGNGGPVVDMTNPVSLVAPMLDWALLDFGRNRAAVQQSTAATDAASADYRQTVLEALRDAEASLSRFGHMRTELDHRRRAQASASQAADLSHRRVAAGSSTAIDELDVERQRLATTIAVVDAEAQLTTDFAAVQKALGLGWRTSEGGD